MTNQIRGFWSEADWYGAVTFDGRPLDPRPSQRLRNHSPDGFAWGYAGSGPAQLALAILLAAGATDLLALNNYQEFKREFLAKAPNQAQLILDVDVAAWLAGRER